MYTFDVTTFREQFPEFASATTYPDALLTTYFAMATQFMDSSDNDALIGDAMILALNTMTAHLLKSNTLIQSGVSSVVVSGSSEGSVSVSLTPPPFKDAWQWWLSTTPYGAQLRALLKAASMTLQYAGGSVERAAFRKGGGVF